MQWAVRGRSRPVRVVGMGATGVANKELGVETEDTITLTVTWENFEDSGRGGGLGFLGYVLGA